jgi:fumarate reductase subunit D
MANHRNSSAATYIPILALLTLYVLLVAFTIVCSVNVPGGAYYRILGLCPVGMIGMVYEGPKLDVVLLVSGAAWWLLIGVIGWTSKNRMISRTPALLGALVCLVSAVMSVALTLSPLSEDLHDGNLSLSAILQYGVAAILFLGAVAATIYSAAVALDFRKQPNSR